MKDRTTAALLAIILGSFGVHRFYTNQTGLGITYLVLSVVTCATLPAILGIIDGIVWLTMSEEAFNRKFNHAYQNQEVHVHVHGKKKGDVVINTSAPRTRKNIRKKTVPPKKTPVARTRKKQTPNNPHKITGIGKFKEYDYKGALESFKKSLTIQPEDVAIHFNLGCCYSMEEDIEKSLYHLDKAVELGFRDFDRIHNHDALSFLRSHDEFLDFVKKDYRWETLKGLDAPQKDLLDTDDEPEEVLDLNAPIKEKVIIAETNKDFSNNRANDFFKDLFGEIEDRTQIEREREEMISDTKVPEIKEEPVADETPPLSPDLVDTLRQLASLRDQGILTEEEFIAQKKRLLG